MARSREDTSKGRVAKKKITSSRLEPSLLPSLFV